MGLEFGLRPRGMQGLGIGMYGFALRSVGKQRNECLFHLLNSKP